MQAVVRKANKNDVQDIASIHVRSWKVAFDGLMPAAYIDKFTLARRVEEWQHIIENRKEHVLVAEAKGQVLGFASFEKEVNDNQTIALNKLYLCPRYYGSGLGRLLMEEIEASAKSQGAKVLSLYVLDSNENAAGFYQKQGFAFGKGYVSEVFDGVTIIDVLMEKQL